MECVTVAARRPTLGLTACMPLRAANALQAATEAGGRAPLRRGTAGRPWYIEDDIARDSYGHSPSR